MCCNPMSRSLRLKLSSETACCSHKYLSRIRLSLLLERIHPAPALSNFSSTVHPAPHSSSAQYLTQSARVPRCLSRSHESLSLLSCSRIHSNLRQCCFFATLLDAPPCGARRVDIRQRQTTLPRPNHEKIRKRKPKLVKNEGWALTCPVLPGTLTSALSATEVLIF